MLTAAVAGRFKSYTRDGELLCELNTRITPLASGPSQIAANGSLLGALWWKGMGDSIVIYYRDPAYFCLEPS